MFKRALRACLLVLTTLAGACARPASEAGAASFDDTSTRPIVEAGALGAEVAACSASRFGINADFRPSEQPPDPAAVAAAGARYVRVEWIDACDEATPPSRFAAYDALFARLAAAGLKVLVLVDYASVMHVPFHVRTDAPWVELGRHFASCAARIAAHYSDPAFGDVVDGYELWNEPDNPPNDGGYDPYVPPTAYADMIARTTRAIRASVREARGEGARVPTLVLGGLDAGAFSGYLEKVLAAAPADGLGVDAIGFHPYATSPVPTWPEEWPDASRNWMWVAHHVVQLRLASHYLPIWITEFGTEDGRIQADYVARFYRLLSGMLAAEVPRAFLFSWKDSRAGTFGLVKEDGTPKPAYCAYRQAALGVTACDAPPPATGCGGDAGEDAGREAGQDGGASLDGSPEAAPRDR